MHIVTDFVHLEIDGNNYHHSSIAEAVADKALIATAEGELEDTNKLTFNDALNDVAIPSRRGLGNSSGGERTFEGTYHLLVAFLAPPLLKLASQDAPLPSYDLLWMNRPQPRSSRISGWKDGNLLYSHKDPSNH
ncbi:hypothetical protein [uncultured Vibrio sp.]|uniref:hypothetical protein n=1 Tax=uncultured Vibrio sp. TaxID=114054 RepID=UPI002635BD51|nr:hypothetical protein [uncultured Vibrio sp.]